MESLIRAAINVNGIVQGVGFRPYVYALAQRFSLRGFVQNTTRGVSIEVEGKAKNVADFYCRLPLEKPAAARIQELTYREIPLVERETEFVIYPSTKGQYNTFICADLALCADCRRELKEAHDRRFGYAFINCTKCGPRFTIIENLPYDRQHTTMRHFTMCDECQREYSNPLQRRFHAEPIACPDCGPQLSYLNADGEKLDGEPLSLAKAALTQGQIVAVKGLGGYHLACDALNEQAVKKLRRRKGRYAKPLAVMMKDLKTVEQYCFLTEQERELLISPAHPIVLLRKKQEALAASVTFHHKFLGVMLPYTPVHELLLEEQAVLVMTSGNYADEPLCYQNQEALRRLGSITDGFLIHDREIFRRCDDSVTQVICQKERVLRRSRGYVPQPLQVPPANQEILAVGGQQKNTFCLQKGTDAIISQHIGDLDDPLVYEFFCQEIAHFKKIFAVQPQLLVHDLHPDYLSTQYALSENLPCLPVQHHHAHLASVLAEHQHQGLAIGVIFDGTGYGEDGNLWGGEFLLGDCAAYQRVAYLDYVPLPGGEKAIKEPWRMGLSYLKGVEYQGQLLSQFPREWPLLWKAVESGINAPLTSSMGRLFDGVAALIGVRQIADYEGQAAVELEQFIRSEQGFYQFAVEEAKKDAKNEGNKGKYLIDWRPLIQELVYDKEAGCAPTVMAARFHNAVVHLVVKMVKLLHAQSGLKSVVFSGGVWQNRYLLERATIACEDCGFQVLSNNMVPVNDGGLSLGQAAIAARKNLCV